MHFELYGSELMDKMLTVNEVAHLLHIHPSTVRRWEKQGQLESYRLGPKSIVRFKRQEVCNFISLAKKLRNGDECGVLADGGSRYERERFRT